MLCFSISLRTVYRIFPYTSIFQLPSYNQTCFVHLQFRSYYVSQCLVLIVGLAWFSFCHCMDISADEAEKISDKTKADGTKETEETKSPRTSVKDMVAGLRNSGGDQPGSPKQERPLSKTEGRPSSKTEGRPPSKTDSTKGSPLSKPKIEENDKEESVKRDSKSENDQKAEADKSDQKAVEVKEDDSVKSVHSPEG